MEYLNSQNIHSIQIDVTSYCNSFCGSCIRNIYGGETNPCITLSHMSWETWKAVVHSEAFANTSLIHFNGNYGDFSMHPEIVEMIDYAFDINPNLRFSINSNGGARDEEFWINLANVLNKYPAHEVVFSIDGLEDTNHIYRRGVKFENIIRNAKAFIKAGGFATWRMIVFDHNKKQIRNARQQAMNLGFTEFKLNRCYDTKLYAKQYKEFPETYFTAPDASTVRKLKMIYDWSSRSRTRGSFYTELKKGPGTCPWQVDRQIQVDPWGNIWPCCYFSIYTGSPESIRFDYVRKIKDTYGNNFNDLSFYSFDDILNHDFFQKQLHKDMDQSKIAICTNYCHGKNTV